MQNRLAYRAGNIDFASFLLYFLHIFEKLFVLMYSFSSDFMFRLDFVLIMSLNVILPRLPKREYAFYAVCTKPLGVRIFN